MLSLTKHFFSQRFISWAMIFLLTISPIQLAMAADINVDGHGENCPMALMHVEGSSMSENCEMSANDQCADHLGCVNMHISASVLKSKLSVLSKQSATRLSLHLYDATLSTHYPELLKRPPKV